MTCCVAAATCRAVRRLAIIAPPPPGLSAAARSAAAPHYLFPVLNVLEASEAGVWPWQLPLEPACSAVLGLHAEAAEGPQGPLTGAMTAHGWAVTVSPVCVPKLLAVCQVDGWRSGRLQLALGAVLGLPAEAAGDLGHDRLQPRDAVLRPVRLERALRPGRRRSSDVTLDGTMALESLAAALAPQLWCADAHGQGLRERRPRSLKQDLRDVAETYCSGTWTEANAAPVGAQRAAAQWTASSSTWWLRGLALLSDDENPAKPDGPPWPNSGRPRRSRATMTASTPARPTRPTPNNCDTKRAESTHLFLQLGRRSCAKQGRLCQARPAQDGTMPGLSTMP